MFTLKIDTFEINVSDFLSTSISKIFDLNFDSAEKFKDFYSFYKTNCSSSLIYEIEGNEYSGSLGNLVYDSNYFVRLYILNEHSDYASPRSVLCYNLNPVIENHERRISKLFDIMCQNSLMTTEESDKYSSYLQQIDSDMDLEHQVENLNKYLIDTKSTMSDLREKLME